MATFGTWLKEAEHSENPQVSDGTKYLARMWNETEGSRPKLYGVESVKRFLEKQPTWSPQCEEPFRAAVAEYHKMRGDLTVATAEVVGKDVGAKLDAIAAELKAQGALLRLIAGNLGLLDDIEGVPAIETAEGLEVAGSPGMTVTAPLSGENAQITLGAPEHHRWDETDWSMAWGLADKQEAAGEEPAA